MAPELTDVASVRQFMQKSVSETFQDEDIEVLIYQASETIERRCNRQFVREGESKKTFEFLPNETWDLIDLKPYEYRGALVLVTLDPDRETPVNLTASQYRPYPYPSRDGSFFGIRFGEIPEPANEPPLPFQTRRVDVTATWGMAAIPNEVQHLCNVTVESWCHLRRDAGFAAGEQFGEGTPARGYDLPPAVFYGLKRWERPTT